LALCPLADNGGPAPTRLPAATSPLVDQIPKAACDAGQSITTDERGVTRPYGSACDIGAVEYAPVQSTTTTAPGSTTTVAAEPVTVNPQFTG
jgi:hypothetical protein